MALLEQLRVNLAEIPRGEASVLFLEYYHKRERELQEVKITPKRTKKTSSPKKGKHDKLVTVSQDQIAILKKLGLI